jgi:hypothetical protein
VKSAFLKTEALCWLRFEKQMESVCTEGGYWNADVMGVCPEFAIEVEVKVSKADLLAEFKNKRAKHAYYQGKGDKWAPNYFYFLVPPDLAEAAVDIVKEKFPKAGVLIYDGTEKRLTTKKRYGAALRCARRPQALHKKKPSAALQESIRYRAASELCSMHIVLDSLVNPAIEQVQELKQSVVDAVKDAHSICPFEPEGGAENDGHGTRNPGIGVPGVVGVSQMVGAQTLDERK